MPMKDQGSVMLRPGGLNAGDIDAARPLRERHSRGLVRSTRQKLRQARHRGLEADEEDAALDSFDRSCRAAAGGHFPQLADRHDHWRQPVPITERKAIDRVRRARRRRRGGGRRVSLGDLDEQRLDGMLSAEPSPELAARMADECRRRLGDDSLRAVALWKVEGQTNREIAARLGCVEPTVGRKPRTIRGLWSSEGPA
jgi:hypothetical protein